MDRNLYRNGPSTPEDDLGLDAAGDGVAGTAADAPGPARDEAQTVANPHGIPEIKARARARGDYFRWLRRRYGGPDPIEGQDDPVPIARHDISIALHLERAGGDDALGRDSLPRDETPTGTPAWDLVLEHPFLAISGCPGTGKTTLIKALMLELLSERPSRLRDGLTRSDRPAAEPDSHPPRRGIAPIPLILRNLHGLDQATDLGDLLDLWWSQELAEAKNKGMPLDEARLRYSFDPDGEGYPLLLLFDGIDEVGGADLRTSVLWLAAEAVLLGHRVIVTGRPDGFADVEPGADEHTGLVGASAESALLAGLRGEETSRPDGIMVFEPHGGVRVLDAAEGAALSRCALKLFHLQPLAGRGA